MYIKISDKHADHTKVIEVQEYEYHGFRLDPDPRKPEEHAWPEAIGIDGAKEIEFFGCVYGTVIEDGTDPMVNAVAIRIPVQEEYRVIVAVECSIYIMGDDGKTVDVVRY